MPIDRNPIEGRIRAKMSGAGGCGSGAGGNGAVLDGAGWGR